MFGLSKIFLYPCSLCHTKYSYDKYLNIDILDIYKFIISEFSNFKIVMKYISLYILYTSN